jgi:predicted RNA methylase
MSTVRINLPNDISIEATPDQAVAILAKLSNTTSETEDQRISRIIAQNAAIKPKLEAELKELETKIVDKKNKEYAVIADLPVTSQITRAQREVLDSIFFYAPNKKSSKGKAPYIAAILMDREIHSMQELKRLSNAPTTTVTFAIQRLREAGSTVEVSSQVMSKNTLVQLTRLAKPKFKVNRTLTRTKTKTQNSSAPAKNSPIIIPKGFTELTV